MALIEKRGPTRGELRWFGLIFAGFFALLGAMSWWRSRGADHHTAAIVLWCIGGGIALIYYLLRPVQRPFYDLLITVAYPIGWVVSHLMIALMYYGLITPIGVTMRLFGRDALRRRFDRSATTYWIAHDPSAAATKRYFQQF
jgi:hypothetical protein